MCEPGIKITGTNSTNSSDSDGQPKEESISEEDQAILDQADEIDAYYNL